jgi:single-stranded-DNA-specific exonuclease
VIPYIPSRVDQGYGLTESSLDDYTLGGKLLISVDCGVRDKELIEKYIDEKKLDFVITDHHQPPEGFEISRKYPLVHQMYPKHEYVQKEICGATIAFLLIQAMKAQVGMGEPFSENTKGFDLVALSSISDLMPLIGVNRILVKYGSNRYRVESEWA